MAMMFWILFPVLVAAILIFAAQSQKKNFVSKLDGKAHQIMEAVGGSKNILSKRASGSKIKFELDKTKLIDKDKLKSLGATGIIVSSNSATIIMGSDSQEIANKIK